MNVAAYSLYYGSLAFLLSLSFLGLFLGAIEVLWIGMPLGVAGLIAGGLLFLVYSAMRPSWAKARELLIVACVTAGAVRLDPTLQKAGVTAFWATREDRATTFVAELLSYGRIREMDDGQRYYNELNGELVALTADRVDTSRVAGLRPTVPVQTVLARDGIEPGLYKRFQQRLRDLKFIHVEVHEDYIGFVYDGILDNLQGFVLGAPGPSPTGAAQRVRG